MLKTIDILLGVTVVMLVVSMAITVLTQFVTTVANTRGRHLLKGLSDLLQQFDPTLEKRIAGKIAEAVLMHPLTQSVSGRLGSTVHREEFTKLLMEIASGNIPKDLDDRLGKEAKNAVVKALSDNGIKEPAKILDNVRSLALQLEISNPEMAADARHAVALMREANSQLVAKVNAWFDQTIDRVADRFTFTTRGVTFACAVAVAVALQLDAIGLINRLSVDDAFRAALVAKAEKIGQQEDQASVKAGLTDPQKKNLKPENQASAHTGLTLNQKRDLQDLANLGVLTFPSGGWIENWDKVNVFGVMLSALMLSLGAPFWYNALTGLLKLRGVIARKDDAQREIRQSTQAASTQAAAPAAAAGASLGPLPGERGILG